MRRPSKNSARENDITWTEDKAQQIYSEEKLVKPEKKRNYRTNYVEEHD